MLFGRKIPCLDVHELCSTPLLVTLLVITVREKRWDMILAHLSTLADERLADLADRACTMTVVRLLRTRDGLTMTMHISEGLNVGDIERE